MLILTDQEKMKKKKTVKIQQSDFGFQKRYCEQNKVVLFVIITIMYVWRFSPTTFVKNENAFIEDCICTRNSSFPKIQDNEC